MARTEYNQTQRIADKTALGLIDKEFSSRSWWTNFALSYRAPGEKSKTFEFTTDLSSPNEWTGSRKFDASSLEKLTVHTKKYEKSLIFDNDDLRDPAQSQLIMQQIPNAISSMMSFYEQKFVEQIHNPGPNDIGYDGLPLFSTVHPVRDSSFTNSNIVSGSGVTEQNISDDFETAISLMKSWSRRDGTKIFENSTSLKTTLLVPAKYEARFRNIFEREPITGSTTQGRHKGEVEFLWDTAIINERDQVAVDDWYLLFRMDNYNIQPTIWLQSRDIETRWSNPGSDMEFNEDHRAYGLSYMFGFQPLYYYGAIKVDN